MAKKGCRATNEERLTAIQMYDNWLIADRIAEILDVGRSSVFDWISKYRKGGLALIRRSGSFRAAGNVLGVGIEYARKGLRPGVAPGQGQSEGSDAPGHSSIPSAWR